FYVWEKVEIDRVLGASADLFNYHYGVEEAGNAPAGADPHGEFTNKNILIERHSLAETARHFGKTEGETGQILEAVRETLLAHRAKRPRPHLDDKIITAWNGSMISAFARAAQVLAEGPASAGPGRAEARPSEYLAAAERAAECVRTHLYDPATKRLARNYREGRSAVEGFADDYAFVVQGLVDLYEASLKQEWLEFALELQSTLDRLFYDGENGGYFSVTGDDPSILLRMKEDNDGAEPAASSVAAINLLRLAQIRDDESMRERAEKTISAFSTTLSRIPSAMPQMLVALDYSLAKPQQIVITGNRAALETRALLRELHRHFLPHKIVLHAEDGAGEAVRNMKPVDGKPTAYVCENFACQAPVNDPAALRQLLS
ncbi:MAG: hypothetical protein LC642_06440, partial [Verrucomicrobiaceae bacterium]|nr:hypothetical protein [Verrucomicrobiaceae bacterium]